jgi:hypothetical protein
MKQLTNKHEPNFEHLIRTRCEKAPSNWACGPHGAALNRMEFLMSIQTKIAALAVAALAVTGSLASTTQAQARGFGLGWGVGAGLLGAAVVGSAIAANDGYYYDGYRRCGWVREFDAYGNFIGRVRSCNHF